MSIKNAAQSIASAALSFDTQITLAEITQALPLIGSDVTLVVQGEPGCGKSSILKNLKEAHGDKYHYVYVDCPMKDIGDIAANIPVHATKSLEHYVSALFPRDGKPIIVMLDELFKSNKMLRLMFTRLMLERTVGDWPLPAGSIVFATSNNAADGVGDFVEGHVGNRVSLLQLKKPDAEEWVLWGSQNGIAPEVLACVHMNPSFLATYRDDPEGRNEYIFNPKKGTVTYVSPRSLEKVSHIVRKRDRMSKNMFSAALAGTVGLPAAKVMAAILSLRDQIVFTKDVVKDPKGVKVPDNKAAIFLMMFNALEELLTQDDLTAFMTFMDRVESSELEGVFFTLLVQNKRTVRLAQGNTRVMSWASKNIELF